jgi:hypothetical protein
MPLAPLLENICCNKAGGANRWSFVLQGGQSGFCQVAKLDAASETTPIYQNVRRLHRILGISVLVSRDMLDLFGLDDRDRRSSRDDAGEAEAGGRE